MSEGPEVGSTSRSLKENRFYSVSYGGLKEDICCLMFHALTHRDF